MRGKTMTQRVRRNAAAHTTQERRLTYEAPRGHAAQAPAAHADEQWTAALERGLGLTAFRDAQKSRSRLVDVLGDGRERHVADRQPPLAVALADDPDAAFRQRDVLQVEVERLAHPQPAGVEQLEQGAVAQPELS